MYDGYKNITMQQLETVFVLREEGSFTRAARRMYLTQPALTRQIKNLEEILGVSIFKRDGHGLALTEEGRILHEYARRILKLREEAKEKIARSQSQEAGDIYISASTIPATYILPYALSDFKKYHPEIRSHIQMAASGETLEAILAGERELGFVGKNPANPRLHREAIWQDRLILAAGSPHPWFERKTATIEELRREPLVIRERGSATREILERSLREKEFPPLSHFRIIAELGSSEAAKEAVLAGLGVTVISKHAVAREMELGLIRETVIDGLEIQRRFYLIWKKQFVLPPCHETFVEFIRNYRMQG